MIKITVRQIILVVVIEAGYFLPCIIFTNIGVFKDILIGFIATSIVYFVMNFSFKDKLNKKIPFIYGLFSLFLGTIVVYSVALIFS